MIRSFLKTHALPLSVAVLYLLFCDLVGVPACPIMHFLKVPCPTCGVSRAILSLLRLDLRAYAEYNVMAVFLVVAAVLMIHEPVIKRKKAMYAFSFSILAVNTVYYALRLWSYFG